ncbi:MAG: TIR domain-containing protein, partial [Chloroflexota bacterium]|nr:TIR domain-containing protein [Chloroflexota bacterium]
MRPDRSGDILCAYKMYEGAAGDRAVTESDRLLESPIQPLARSAKYDGFISYSHAADGQLAPAVQAGLQRLAKPWNRRRALWIFRDDTGLTVTPALWSSIQTALDDSRFFILMASPEAAASHWVNQEIKHWVETKPVDRILPVLTSGEWVWDSSGHDFDWQSSTAVPQALEGVFQEEPRYLDLRWAHTESQLNLRHSRFRGAIADLAAPMHGSSKEDLESEDIHQYRRSRRLRLTAVVSLVVLATVALFSGVMALINASHAETSAAEARHQQRVAEERRQQAAAATAEAARQQRLAEDQQKRADEQTKLAASRRVAAQAVSDLDDHLDRSLLLSLEALRLADTPEARAALFAALERHPRLTTFLQSSGSSVNSVAASSDGKLLASGSDDGRITLWDTQTHKVRKQLVVSNRVQNPSPVQSVAFSPDGRILASGSGDHAVQLWDVQHGKLVRTLRGHELGLQIAVNSVAFSPDGRLLASGEEFGTVVLWDAQSGQPIRTLHLSDIDDVYSVAFSPDGKVLASGEVGSVVLSDIHSGEPIRTLQVSTPSAPYSNVYSVAFSPDGRLLASGDGTGKVVLW